MPDLFQKTESAFQCGLHLHVPQFWNGDVQVLLPFRPCVVVRDLQQQLRKSEVCQGKFRAGSDLAGRFQGLHVISTRSYTIAYQ